MNKKSKGLPKALKIWCYSLGLGFLLLILANLSVHLAWWKPEEALIVKSTQLKKSLNHSWVVRRSFDEHYIEKNFLLVNVNNDYALSGPSDTQSRFAPRRPITDRRKLAALMRWCNRNPSLYSKVFCDLLFLEPASNKVEDDSLGAYLDSLQLKGKILFAGLYNPYDGRFAPPVFKEIRQDKFVGTVNSQHDAGKLSSFKLSEDHGNVKSFPLLMYESLSGSRTTGEKWGFLQLESKNDRLLLANRFIPEMIFDAGYFAGLKRAKDATAMDSTIGLIDLGEAVEKESIRLEGILDVYGNGKRSLFIGSFDEKYGDVHPTAYGQMSGSMILLNIHYNLVTNQNAFDAWFYIFMFLGYSLVFASIFFQWPQLSYEGNNLLKRFVSTWLVKYFHYWLLVFLTLASNVFFQKVTNIIVLFPVVFFFYAVQKHRAHGHASKKKNSYTLPSAEHS